MEHPIKLLKVLFVCTGNSARSQMAEGFARHFGQGRIEAHSAGMEPSRLNPFAVAVMREKGIDISGQQSKAFDWDLARQMDIVVTVCGHANETCPAWLGRKAKIVHVGFDDPPKLAMDAKSEEEALVHYRRVRDEIRDFVESLPGSLAQPAKDRT